MNYVLILLQVFAVMSLGILIGMLIMMFLYKSLLNFDLWKEIKQVSGRRSSQRL